MVAKTATRVNDWVDGDGDARARAAGGPARPARAAAGAGAVPARRPSAGETGEERRQTLQEDAIREACGEDAQRLDREMRAERRQWQGHWNVLVRHDTLLHEEKREREDQHQRERLQKLAARSSPTGSRDRGEPGWTR